MLMTEFKYNDDVYLTRDIFLPIRHIGNQTDSGEIRIIKGTKGRIVKEAEDDISRPITVIPIVNGITIELKVNCIEKL